MGKHPVFLMLLLIVLASNALAVEYTSASLRDPFSVPGELSKIYQKQATQVSTAPSNFRVQGILFKGPKIKAIINNKVVGIGDDVEGAKVLDIMREGVKLSINSEEVFIKIIGK